MDGVYGWPDRRRMMESPADLTKKRKLDSEHQHDRSRQVPYSESSAFSSIQGRGPMGQTSPNMPPHTARPSPSRCLAPPTDYTNMCPVDQAARMSNIVGHMSDVHGGQHSQDVHSHQHSQDVHGHQQQEVHGQHQQDVHGQHQQDVHPATSKQQDRNQSMDPSVVNLDILQSLKTLDSRDVSMVQADLGNLLRPNTMLPASDFSGDKEKLTFPLATLEEFHTFEEALEDEAYKLQMVSELVLQGGSTARKQCRLVMQRLLAAELAHTFNWLGRGSQNKIAFSNTHTADTVRRVMIQYGHTIKIAEDEMKEFLRTSGDRLRAQMKQQYMAAQGYTGASAPKPHNNQNQFTGLMDSPHAATAHIEPRSFNGDRDKIVFPLLCIEEFHFFEEALEDDTYKLQMVSELMLQGGDGARKQCRLVMRKLLSPELSRTFNWLGRGSMNKVAFNNTHTADTICRVMIQHGHTIKTAQDEIKEFLRTSGDRMKSAPAKPFIPTKKLLRQNSDGNFDGFDSSMEGETNPDGTPKITEKNQTNFESISSLDILQGFKAKRLDGEEEKITFPLSSMDEFSSFEEALEDDVYKLQIVSELVLQGGTDARKQCRLVMQRLLCPELAHTFNWLGRGSMNKVAFCNTHTADTIRRVMIQYGHTVQIAETEMKEFLRTSGDRMKTAMRFKMRPPGAYPGHRRPDMSQFANLAAASNLAMGLESGDDGDNSQSGFEMPAGGIVNDIDILHSLKSLDHKLTRIQVDFGNLPRLKKTSCEKDKIMLPLTNMTEFHNFEEALMDDTYKMQMVSELMLQGGSTARKQCRLVLRRLLNPDLARIFNWLGRGSMNKVAFSNTQTADIIRRVMVQYGHTVKTAEDEVKEYLRTVGDRRTSWDRMMKFASQQEDGMSEGMGDGQKSQNSSMSDMDSMSMDGTGESSQSEGAKQMAKVMQRMRPNIKFDILQSLKNLDSKVNMIQADLGGLLRQSIMLSDTEFEGAGPIEDEEQ